MAKFVKISDTNSTIKASYLNLDGCFDARVSENSPGVFTLYVTREANNYSYIVGDGYTDLDAAENALKSLIDGQSLFN